MTPDTQQARAGYRRPQVQRRDSGSTIRPETPAAEAARTGYAGGAARRPHAFTQQGTETKRARKDAGIVGVIPLLAVLVAVIAGVYITWSQGSAGAGKGSIVGGTALFAGAAARLLLPAGLAGLLTTRKRMTDVITLAVLGVSLLVTGLVLPR